jgi:rare lipoprotein A
MDFMKPKFIGSLTAAVVMSTLGAPLTGNAQQVEPDDTNLSPVAHADRPDAGTATADGDSGLSTQTAAVQASPAAADELESFRVLPHALDQKSAATLYVRNIPVLTFLGEDEATAQGGQLIAVSSQAEPLGELTDESVAQDPVWRATAIASRLHQLSEEDSGADAIAVRWNSDERTYEIMADGETLVAVGNGVMLPDTTQDPAQDALQAANRMRRLLGGAEPLSASDIEGRPAPQPRARQVAASNVQSRTEGIASWYGPGFHGNRSASGEVFNQNALTAAHRTLPFGTVVRVVNLNNGRDVVVRINDRGPYTGGRIIDLSRGAAQEIGLTQSGVGRVRVEVLETP